MAVPNPLQRARRFIARYGDDSFKRLMTLFKNGASMQDIADEFGVTRQRAYQLRDIFGKVEVRHIYTPDPSLSTLLGPNAMIPVANGPELEPGEQNPNPEEE